MTSLEAYLREQRQRVEASLDTLLPVSDSYPPELMDAMRYSVFAGGKRLRPILMMAAAEAVGGSSVDVLPAACALEYIHTYSMIHDDLPAMDNDDYRRGKLTNHKVYGEDIAILAGDGLLSYAFEFVATQTKNVLPQQVLQVIARLGKAVGAAGLVGGQVVDLASEGVSEVSEETLNFIHTHKTGALLEAVLVMEETVLME